MFAPNGPWSVEQNHQGTVTIRTDYEMSDAWSFVVMVRSDAHHDNPHCRRDLERADLEKARKLNAPIIDNGDLFCAMQGAEDKRGSKSSIRPEHQTSEYWDALVETAADFYQPYADLFVTLGEGNHECVDEQTEVLTDRGFVPIPDVCADDRVAMIHPLSLETMWQRPLKIHRYDYNGEMHHYKHRSCDMLVTPNHRIAYTRPCGRLDYVESRLLGDLSPVRIKVPTSGQLPDGGESSISDNDICVAAWLLTDGTLKGSRATIYQSKQPMVARIRDLLVEGQWEFRERVRDPRTVSIMGVALKSKPLPQHEFALRDNSRVVALGLDANKHTLPKWADALDSRQSDLFLRELILGDGSRNKQSPSSMMLYGNREFLTAVQEWLVVRGYRAMLSWRNAQTAVGGYWCLNIVAQTSTTLRVSDRSVVHHAGHVYCLATAAGNFIARRGGKVFVTGNSSANRKHETNLTKRLAKELRNRTGSMVPTQGYTGWGRVLFTRQKYQKRFSWWRTHGYGGGGPVTKDTIQLARQRAYISGADIMISGHTHSPWAVPDVVQQMNRAGMIERRKLLGVKTATYKDEHNNPAGGGYAKEKGHPPRPLGCCWLIFRREERDPQVFALEDFR